MKMKTFLLHNSKRLSVGNGMWKTQVFFYIEHPEIDLFGLSEQKQFFFKDSSIIARI